MCSGLRGTQNRSCFLRGATATAHIDKWICGEKIANSPTALAAHLYCTHLTQLERQRRAGTLVVEFRADPRVEALWARGLQHEAAYVARLGAAGRTIHDLTGQRDPAATLAAMHAGHGAIVQAPLAA